MRRLLSITTLVLACSAAAAAPQTQVGGVRFAPDLQLAGQALSLNGAGLRAHPMLKGFAAALYLGQRTSDPRHVVAQPGPKRLQIRMLLDVPAEEFVKAFHKGVQRNTPAPEQPNLTERMARFDGLLRPLGKVRKGDLVNLDFVPGQGLLFSHNGKLLGPAIPGEDLYGALLRIFVGERPVDPQLKAGLLGTAA
ncbi:chalcone isomerase family protein [Aquincola sp. S2]|uniref:Chalcone isomerase family protein n=1 Tax=Pseudaquabacterium terrae TaxID=2732868 RepID=A0ABX2EIF7_9BURK|nr:chalcone isomerase family protein [Aquabacterium terrae]NRF68399.1 chalcone isomerase family protein [Aquabacterium terrae]